MQEAAHSLCSHAPQQACALVGRPDELLCIECFYDPMRERGVFIELEDLKPCPINMRTCFDWYARRASPDIVQTWLDEYDQALNNYDPD